MPEPYHVAVYYFPNYHPDPRNAKVHGPGWTEWELVRQARPRYAGHPQPRVPAWGYEDESDPEVMEKKISVAAGYGIDAFIFDWYWYDDGPFLEGGLEQGFLASPNHDQLKFAVMWANHDWIDIHPAKLHACLTGIHPLLYPGTVTRQTFEQVVDFVIEHYFKHPAYWRIDGAPYFSIYDLPTLVRSLGSVAELRTALGDFRAKTRVAGFPGLHLNQVLWNTGILPGETILRNPGDLLETLGFDSFTSYVWIHHVPLGQFPETDYLTVFERYLEYWEQITREIRLPYFPNATMGWDASPRTVQSDSFINAGYPFMPSMNGNTPHGFRQALEVIKARMSQSNQEKRILTINAWNEWTEGSYLEPDTWFGMEYLEAIRDVFKG